MYGTTLINVSSQELNSNKTTTGTIKVLKGTDYYLKPIGLGSVHQTIDLYKSGVAWVNKAKAIEEKKTYPERKVLLMIDSRYAGALMIKVDGKEDKVVTPPFIINFIEKGEEPC